MNWESLGIFILGFVSCILIFGFLGSLEVPFNTGFAVLDGKVSAPSDYIGEEDIIVLKDRIILKIGGATLSSYANSGSMVPVLDKGANGIRIVPLSENEVSVGDIISFRYAGALIVHRVVDKGFDGDGVYFIIKGDANLVGDGKIRFKDIKYKTVGILY